MQCRNHPDRAAVVLCQKLGTGFCGECCECLRAEECCGCLDPKVYCQYRTQCLVWEMSRARRRAPAADGDSCAQE
ncbi:MAG TPA: hypothetical protein VN317_01850 [Candidatus Methanoperedens sp.]|nr:hypothetical protein [Candidatus Methanoperedens sp.]